MKRLLTWHLGLALGLVAVCAALTFGPPIKRTAGTVAFSCQANAEVTCYRSYYQTLTAKQGPKPAFDDLKARYNDNASVKADCHQITHFIGRAAAERQRDVSQAYVEGDNFCWSGYYHGVMEGIIGHIGIEQLTKESNNICSGVRVGKEQYSFFHYNCAHGLGHGFMANLGDELFTSLTTCDSLRDWWEKESCYGGVFMENIMADLNKEFHATKYLKPDQPLYPCTAVAEAYKHQCYLMQTSYALKVSEQDFSKVFALCATVDGSNRAVCYQSLGRDASGNSISNVDQTYSSCMLGPDQEARSNCVIGAVKDFISYYHSDEKGYELCRKFESELRSVCESTAKEYYKSFEI